jgi:hypothetical protein
MRFAAWRKTGLRDRIRHQIAEAFEGKRATVCSGKDRNVFAATVPEYRQQRPMQRDHELCLVFCDVTLITSPEISAHVILCTSEPRWPVYSSSAKRRAALQCMTVIRSDSKIIAALGGAANSIS